MSVTIQDYGVKKSIDDLSKLFTSSQIKSLLLQLGMQTKINILNRTAAGKDVNNNLFIPYSHNYKLFRKKHGHPTDKVNLFFKGEMLGSTSVKAAGDKVIIYFSDQTQSEKARRHHYGEGWLPKREFFALNTDDLVEIEKTVDVYIQKAMGR